MNELLQTERTYVADLNCVIEVRIFPFVVKSVRKLFLNSDLQTIERSDNQRSKYILEPVANAGKHATEQKARETR